MSTSSTTSPKWKIDLIAYFSTARSEYSLKDFYETYTETFIQFSKDNNRVKATWKKRFNSVALGFSVDLVDREPDWAGVMNLIKQPLSDTHSASVNASSTTYTSTFDSRKSSTIPANMQFIFGVNNIDAITKIAKWDIEKCQVPNSTNDDIIRKFNDFQRNAYQRINSARFNYKTQHQELLAMSSIMLLDPHDRCSFLSDHEFNLLYDEQYAKATENEELPDDVYKRIVRAVIDYSITRSKWDFVLAVAQIGKDYEEDDAVTAVLSVILSLREELNDSDVAMSEMFVQNSIIHPLVRSLCKTREGVVPHSSNKKGAEKQQEVINGIPDYRIDVYLAPYFAEYYTNLYGEVKPEDARGKSECLAIDFQKIAIFGKLGLANARNYTDHFVTYQSVGTEIEFYADHEYKPGFTIKSRIVDKMTVPTKYNNFSLVVGMAKPLYKVANFYRIYCFPRDNYTPSTIATISPTLPFSVVKHLIKSTKNSEKRKVEEVEQ